MINKMRDLAPTIMFIILIAFVSTIFLDWGMNVGSKGPKGNVAGKINGKEVPLNYFDQQVMSERQRLQQSSREPSPMETRRIPQDVWEREVNRILMSDVIKKMKLDASADQVFEYIKRNPLPGIDTSSHFMTNGVFDTSKYVQFLTDPDMYQHNPWLNYIAQSAEKEVVPAQNLQSLLSANLVPAKSEIEHQYRIENEKLVFEYATVNTAKLKIDSSMLNEQALKKLYDNKKDSLKTEEKAQIYFAKFPKIPTSYDEQVYFQEMLDFKKQIEAAENPIEEFTRLAQTLSDDPSAESNSGDLGWFGRGAMVPEFENVAFTLDSGKVSDPVKTRYGYHIITVEGKETKDGSERVKARHILRKITPTIETIDQLSEKADSLREVILEKGFAETAKNNNDIQMDSTDFFSKGDIIPGIGYVSGAGQYIYGDEKDKPAVSERLENEDAIFLIAIKGKTKKGTMSFEMAKDTLKGILTDSLTRVAAREYMEKTLKTVGSDGSLEKLKDTDSNLVSGVTDTVTRGQYIAGIGYNSKIAAAAYAIPTSKVSSLIQNGNTFYLVKPLWKSKVDSIPWDSKDVEMIADRMKGQLAQRAYYDWYMAYKSDAKVVSHINDLYID